MTMSFDTRTARPESPLNEPDRLDRSRRPPVPSVVGMGARALFDTTCPSQPASKHTVCASRTMQPVVGRMQAECGTQCSPRRFALTFRNSRISDRIAWLFFICSVLRPAVAVRRLAVRGEVMQQ